MKLSKNESGNAAFIVVAVVVGLVIGFTAGKVLDKKKTVTVTNNTSTGITASAEGLDNTLVTLGLQHMTLTDQAVDAALDGSSDATALGTALNTNGTDIGAAVGSVYGASAQKTFDTVWQYHLNQFVAYAVADKEGNATAKQTALNNINSNYTIPLAKYLAAANPNLPESVLQTALSDHVAMTATMIDDHVQGNFTAEQAELNMADTHIQSLFSTLAGAIVKQYPSKFSS
jgi:uncharacterized membrane protein YeaQ/YmgE (transglycosylase-associated protein family)